MRANLIVRFPRMISHYHRILHENVLVFFFFANKKKSLAVEINRKQIAFSRSAVFSQQSRRSKQGYLFRVKNPQREREKQKSCFPLTRKVHPRIFLFFFVSTAYAEAWASYTNNNNTSSKKKCHRQPKKGKKKKDSQGT
jgi:hypothetical protein